MPRPSSPVHAKAFTKCPYLTLESPHHQRQRWAAISCRMTTTRHAPSRYPVWIFKSQPLSVMIAHTSIRRARYRHGIDFKNPFTMSKRGQIPQYRSKDRTVVFIPGVFATIAVLDVPQGTVQRPRRLLRRLGGFVARPSPGRALRRQIWWSLSGSNR